MDLEFISVNGKGFYNLWLMCVGVIEMDIVCAAQPVSALAILVCIDKSIG